MPSALDRRETWTQMCIKKYRQPRSRTHADLCSRCCLPYVTCDPSAVHRNHSAPPASGKPTTSYNLNTANRRSGLTRGRQFAVFPAPVRCPQSSVGSTTHPRLTCAAAPPCCRPQYQGVDYAAQQHFQPQGYEAAAEGLGDDETSLYKIVKEGHALLQVRGGGLGFTVFN